MKRLILSCGLLLALAGNSFAAASPFSLVTATPKTLTPAALTAAQQTITHGQAAADKKALTFRQKTVRLVIVSGPANDMLSYRVDGLRNPKLIVPRGATLNVLFVNTDDDMFHNIRFGGAQKAYTSPMEPYLKASVGTPSLPHKSDTALHGEELTLHAPATPGTYAYFCAVEGHAQGGMTGLVVVH